jgi:hypothetical protein
MVCMEEQSIACKREGEEEESDGFKWGGYGGQKTTAADFAAGFTAPIAAATVTTAAAAAAAAVDQSPCGTVSVCRHHVFNPPTPFNLN